MKNNNGMEIGCGIEELCFHPDPSVLIQSEYATTSAKKREKRTFLRDKGT